MMKPIPFEKMAHDYAEGKLDFEPGSRFSYSNTGYILLGGIIEKVAGESFGKFLERRILKPLKMEQSRFGPSKSLPSLCTGYSSFALGEPEPAHPEADGWIDAAGGLFASASDLLKWDLALVDGKVLKPESYKAMTLPRVLTTGKISNYACGLSVQIRNGETTLRHTGGVSGFHLLQCRDSKETIRCRVAGQYRSCFAWNSSWGDTEPVASGFGQQRRTCSSQNQWTGGKGCRG